MSSAHSIVLKSTVDPILDDADVARALQLAAKHIERSHAGVERVCFEGVWYAAQAGEHLHFVKDRIPHGEFKRWLSQALPTISVRTCERYMEVARILQALPDYPVDVQGAEISKAAKASQLQSLRSNGLSSLRKVLALHKTSSSEDPPKQLALGPMVSEEIAPAPLDCDDDWQTPSEIIDAVVELLGAIDLDPCGIADRAFHLHGVKTLTPADDSLSSAKWRGRCFVHPPLSNVGPFAERAAAAVTSGEAEEAMAFMPAEMDATHMGVLQPFAKGFLRMRPTFASAAGELAQPAWPYMLVFLTRDADRIDAFADACGHLADIYYPHRF